MDVIEVVAYIILREQGPESVIDVFGRERASMLDRVFKSNGQVLPYRFFCIDREVCAGPKPSSEYLLKLVHLVEAAKLARRVHLDRTNWRAVAEDVLVQGHYLVSLKTVHAVTLLYYIRQHKDLSQLNIDERHLSGIQAYIKANPCCYLQDRMYDDKSSGPTQFVYEGFCGKSTTQQADIIADWIDYWSKTHDLPSSDMRSIVQCMQDVLNVNIRRVGTAAVKFEKATDPRRKDDTLSLLGRAMTECRLRVMMRCDVGLNLGFNGGFMGTLRSPFYKDCFIQCNLPKSYASLLDSCNSL